MLVFTVHCFPGAIVGLKYHDNLVLNTTDIPGGYSMFDFKQFLGKAYNLKIKKVSKIKREKMILILISGQKSRLFLNENDIVGMMEKLGFQVIVTRSIMMSNLSKFAEVMNACSVLVGAHGAGLTNGMFLPAGAVLLQVMPLGSSGLLPTTSALQQEKWVCSTWEYMIEPDESCLSEIYGRDHPLITDPSSVFSKGNIATRAINFDAQNLKIGVKGFREAFVQALKLIGMSESSGTSNRHSEMIL